MNEPAKKPDFTSNPRDIRDAMVAPPRRVIELRCKEPLHIGNDMERTWHIGRSKSGSCSILSMEMLPMGVLIRSEAGKARKATLVPFANILTAGLEE